MAKGTMKPDEVDICERGVVEEFGEEVFGKLLLDHTTGRNIYWATDSYAGRGEGFGFRDPIEIGKICGEERVIRPRAVKSREEQAKAETRRVGVGGGRERRVWWRG